MTLTQKDRRALALLSKYGAGIATPYAGFWRVGGYRVAQTTVRRLLARGLAQLDPENRQRLLSTDDTLREASDADLPLEAERDYEVPPSERRRRPRLDGEEWGFEEPGWRPEEPTDRLGRPLPVDYVIGEED